MYHRHSTSSNDGGTPCQQPYPFQRARSMEARRPQSQHKRIYDSNTYRLNSNAMNTSSSSMPDTAKNYHNNTSNSAKGSDEYDNTKYNKRNNNIGSMSLQSVLVWRIFPFLVLILVPWMPNQFTRYEVRAKKLALELVLEEQKDLVERLDKTTEKIRQLKQEVESLHKDNELSYQELKRNGKIPGNLAAGDEEVTGENSITNVESEEYAKLEEEEEILVNRIDRLEKSIQKSAVKRLTNSYGYGRYRFQVNVRTQNGVQKFFVIETAMLAEMPHAIDHFFQMVEKKLWDGLALTHEAFSSIISAKPMMTDESHAWAGQRFVDANLTHMAFTEHSPTFPPPHHRKFSVAFSGRPGGPGFYISLDDELEFKHDYESTFGVVMEGRDTLYQLFMQKGKGVDRILKIESIDILPTRKLKPPANSEGKS